MAVVNKTDEVKTDGQITLNKADLAELIEQAVADRISRMDNSANSNVLALGESIANATAEIANQGVGKRPVLDPKIVKARREANKAMHQAIRDADETPTYQINNVCFLSGVMVFPKWNDPRGPEQTTIIEWRSAPNLAMSPVNATAKKIYALFEKSIGHAAEEADVQSPYPESPGKALKFLSGGPQINDVVDLGKQHAADGSDGFKIVAGQPAARTDNRLLNVINRVNLSG